MRFRVPTILVAALLASSCSTTRVLQMGEFRLVGNEINVSGDPKFDAGELQQYIRQQANTSFVFGWNPFLSIYNWSNGEKGILNRLCRSIGEAPVVYDPALVGISARNIEARLDYLGYYGSQVSTRVIPHGRKVTVYYDVVLGKRFVIDGLEYKLPEGDEFAADFMADTSRCIIRKGDYLSEMELEQERARSAAYLRNLGWYGMTRQMYSFVADTLSNPGHVMLDYVVAGPVSRYRVGDVTISRPKNLPFKDDVLINLNTIHKGDIYNETTVNNTYNRLAALRVFNSVGVEMLPRDNAVVDCNISLSQSKTQGFKTSFEMSSNSSGLLGVSPQFSYYHKNVFHGGEWLNMGFTGNFQFKPGTNTSSNELGVSTGLSFPKFVGLPYSLFNGPSVPRTDINASFNYQERPEYTRTIFSGSYGYSGTLKNNFSYQVVPVRLNFVRLFNLDPAFSKTMDRYPLMRYSYQDHLDAGLGAVLYHTTNTDIVPRTDYRYTRFAFDLSGNVLSVLNPLLRTSDAGSRLILGVPYAQYVRAEIQRGRVWRFGQDDGKAIAARFVLGAGYAYGNSSALPYEEQFYCGGANSMRGWQAREVGPGSMAPDKTFSIPSQTGDVKLEMDLEYRVDLFWKLQGAVFAEMGNVWNLAGEQPESVFRISDFYKTIAADWGVGVRADLGFILLRLDYGIKVYDPSSADSRWRNPSMWLRSGGHALHFGVGYPF